MKLKLIFVCLLVVLARLPVGAIDPVSPALHPALQLLESQRPLVIGHRGYCQFAPENTTPSFKLALDAGADLVELDYHHTKDGQMVVVHDFTLDRTTDAVQRWGGTKIRVNSKTAEEILSLDAGSWFDPKFAGTKVRLLGEELDAIQGSGGITLIERKAGDAPTLAKLLNERQMINRVIVQSFYWHFIREFHELEPSQVLGAIGPPVQLTDGTKSTSKDKQLSAAWLDEVQKTGAKIVVWDRQVSRESVALAHQREMKVWIYTINDVALANTLLDMGVDGLISNNTALMWKALALRPSPVDSLTHSQE